MSSTDIVLFAGQNPALKQQLSSVEQYTPWIRKIHVLCTEQIPDWLEKARSDKLYLVTPSDIIPADTPAADECTAAAASICLHRIPDLAEQFILLYPGRYFISNIEESDFFTGGLPTDCAILSPILPAPDLKDRLEINDTEIVNDRFGGFSMVRSHKKLWFSFRYGSMVLRTLQFLPLRQMVGFYDPGQPVCLLKSTCHEVWDTEPEVMQAILHHRAASPTDIDERLYRYWQLAKGSFVPRKLSSMNRKLRIETSF